mmetsp:Transcript_6202/g.15078  ORF Transcript_6202/g.15078 Transcript_6202/m.15078 type:complete len:242 (+) Transcript_6202:184-909(+)
MKYAVLIDQNDDATQVLRRAATLVQPGDAVTILHLLSTPTIAVPLLAPANTCANSESRHAASQFLCQAHFHFLQELAAIQAGGASADLAGASLGTGLFDSGGAPVSLRAPPPLDVDDGSGIKVVRGEFGGCEVKLDEAMEAACGVEVVHQALCGRHAKKELAGLLAREGFGVIVVGNRGATGVLKRMMSGGSFSQFVLESAGGAHVEVVRVREPSAKGVRLVRTGSGAGSRPSPSIRDSTV